MSENKHANVAQYGELTAEERQIEATLALAYEQRTANLIALFTQEGLDMNYGYIMSEINERLGL